MPFKNINLKVLLTFCVLLYRSLYGEASRDPESIDDHCLHESFQPRCMKNEVILMKSATYGRMRTGRCISSKGADALGLAYGQDPRYLGCSVDILDILDRRCSGRSECEVRVADMSLENATPSCFPELMVYLETSFECINVVDEERSCSVMASIVPTHIIGSMFGSQRVCGSQLQPWTVEAPVGQKIRISLLDFGASKAGQTVELSKQACLKYGIIMDKGNKRNVSICGGGAQREQDLYTSPGNVLELFLNQKDQKNKTSHEKQFILRVEAVGCSDLIPPEDAWLKRSDDSIVIGCYSSRQTWHLHCEGEKWIGVFGNCSQAQENVVELEQMVESWNDEQVLTMVAVGGFTLTICLAVLCTGIICLRRYSAQSKKRQDYRTLNFHSNSARSQQVQSTTVSDNTAGGDRAAHEMRTYSVFVGESDFNDVDKPISYNQTNPSVRL